jgi:hypothetical protein
MANVWGGDVVLDVHAKREASRTSLIALGRALEAIQSQEPRITSIHGVQELLQGRYPSPCEPYLTVPDPEGEVSPFDGRRYSIPEPWLYCFARVTARGITDEELIAVLRRAISVDLGEVTEMDTGHY